MRLIGKFASHHRDYFMCAPSQWEMMLQCDVVSHWMGAWRKWSLQYRTTKQIISSDDRMNAEQSEALLTWEKVSKEISNISKIMFKCGDYNNFPLQYLFWKRRVMGSYLPLMQNKLLGLDLNLNVLVLLKHTSLSSRPCYKVCIYIYEKIICALEESNRLPAFLYVCHCVNTTLYPSFTNKINWCYIVLVNVTFIAEHGILHRQLVYLCIMEFEWLMSLSANTAVCPHANLRLGR